MHFRPSRGKQLSFIATRFILVPGLRPRKAGSKLAADSVNAKTQLAERFDKLGQI
jgi:hypothetical protein